MTPSRKPARLMTMRPAVSWSTHGLDSSMAPIGASDPNVITLICTMRQSLLLNATISPLR